MTPSLPPAQLRRAVVVAAHLLVWAAAYFGAYALRFDGWMPPQWERSALLSLPITLALFTAVFWWSRLFHGVLRYAGIAELKAILRSSTVAVVALLALGVVFRSLLLPRSIYVGVWVLGIVGASGLRLGVRLLREQRGPKSGHSARATLLIGESDACEGFLRQLSRAPSSEFRVVGLLDTDGASGGLVHGVPVLGAPTESNVRRAREDLGASLAILASPKTGTDTRALLEICRSLELEVKTMPSIDQIMAGHVRVSMFRDVAIEDLLRRDPIQLDQESMARMLKGRRVLITGGAGSIGSELARQCLTHGPSELAVLDHNENALFFLERELKDSSGSARILPIIADIKDATRIAQVLRDFRPHSVLHAAAHKHVPLMEQNPAEAIKNNVFGTKIVADLCSSYGVDNFVLISTDKAVNPTSIMGATKRVAEMYLQSVAETSRTRYVAVRFGNVLGSAGSVVQIFRDQIAKGGPVTVTDPEMRRYFMTIPEACQLVLQAGALAEGGEIFLLDMGEPVKIVDLARDMIRMSGLEPGVDIKIEFSGVRPGEKLYEEMLIHGEGASRKVHPKIVVGSAVAPDAELVRAGLLNLKEALDSPRAIRDALAVLVPEVLFEGAMAPEDPPADVLHEYQRLSGLEAS